MNRFKAPKQVLNEPIYSINGKHLNPTTYGPNRVELTPRHDVDLILSRLRKFDVVNPTKSKKMQWLQTVFPDKNPEQIFALSQELHESAQSRVKRGIAPDLRQSYERRPLSFMRENEAIYDNGIPKDLPATRTVESEQLAHSIHSYIGEDKAPRPQISIVDRAALPQSIGDVLSAFERATNTKVKIVRVENENEQPIKWEGVTLKDGTIYVNEKSSRPLVTVASHEFVHQLSKDSPELYKQLEAEVLKQGGLKKYIREKGVSEKEAPEELTADAVADALSDPTFLRRLAERNPTTFRTLAERFIAYLKDLGNKLLGLGSNEYLQDVQRFRATLEDVLARYTPRDREGSTSTPSFSRQTVKENALRQLRRGEIDLDTYRAIIDKNNFDTLKFIKDVNRFRALSSPLAVPKLFAAVGWRITFTPLEQAVVSALKAIPIIRKVANKAARYKGFSYEAEHAALQGTLRGLREMWRVAVGKEIDIDRFRDYVDSISKSGENEFGIEPRLSRPVLDFWTRIHAAIKTPAKLNEFNRSYTMYMQARALELAQDGHSFHEIRDLLQSPNEQLFISIKSYVNAQKAILIGNNALYQAIEGMLAKGKASDMLLAKGLAHTTELLMPVRKVPINFFSEMMEYGFGGLNALGLLKKGVENLTQEEADFILRNLSKQTIGVALAAITLAGLVRSGGYYTGDKRDFTQKPRMEQIQTPLGSIEPLLAHFPALHLMHVINTYTKLVERGEDKGMATLRTAAYTTEHNVPLAALFSGFMKAMNANAYEKQAFIDNMIVNFTVPSFLSATAKALDEYRNPGVTGRKANDLKQRYMSKIPILREQLPAYRD